MFWFLLLVICVLGNFVGTQPREARNEYAPQAEIPLLEQVIPANLKWVNMKMAGRCCRSDVRSAWGSTFQSNGNMDVWRRRNAYVVIVYYGKNDVVIRVDVHNA